MPEEFPKCRHRVGGGEPGDDPQDADRRLL